MQVSTVRSASLWVAALCVTATTLAQPALAQTGVSDDRVSLPDGPGSLDGIGDNASVDENMGLMNHSINFSVPGGWEGVTPSLSLGYSSGGGASVAGIGWSMSLPTIERMTARGLPEYDDTDTFVANGGAELVKVAGDAATDAPWTYRSRFEGGFVRYTWHERGAGDEGYWTAESPDGITSYFGADSNGTPVETARQRSADGVFRYLLVESHDLFGHRVEYDYAYQGAVPLVSTVSYAFHNDVPENVVSFTYEARDDLISDAKGGFNELLAHRLSEVLVEVDGAQLRRYAISYESYATAGGVSRISEVRRYGADDGLHPAHQQFTYSQSLGGLCDDETCKRPFLVDVGNVGVDLAAGQATLMDMNGDALPDFLVTSETEAHKIYIANYQEDGAHDFEAPLSSALGNDTTGFRLDSPYTQVLDYNGDGFTDIVNAQLGQVLVNKGGGDWDAIEALTGDATGNLPDFGDDFDLDQDADLAHIRFLDYDLDRKIDVVRSELSSTSIYKNNGGTGFSIDANVQAIGAGFSDENLEFADMNGDGLLDPVILRAGEVSYRLNLGRGQWSSYDVNTPWTTIVNAPVTADELPFASFEDLNGDGLDDLVVVVADEIRYALNRNATTFSEIATITNVVSSATGNEVSIPTRGESTVLFADMNANGSNDVVWVTTSGDVTYLELFPVRPNLLARVENGMGLVVEVDYASAIEHRARDNGDGWDEPTPLPMLVVEQIDSYVEGATVDDSVHNVRSYAYHAAFYDGVEKQFRGFAKVDALHEGNDTQEEVTITTLFDVGAGENRAHFAGLVLEKHFIADGEPMQRVENTYVECDVGGVDNTGLERPVVWACLEAEQTVKQEKQAASEWATLRTEYTHDGYGNVVREADLGVINIGGGGCPACTAADDEFAGPCGAMCLGDEQYEETDYVAPANVTNWLLGLAYETRVYAEEGGMTSRERIYYDGTAFEGLDLGNAERGLISRDETLLNDDGDTTAGRYSYDAHGNVLVQIHSNHDPGQDGGRFRYTYDETGKDIVRQEHSVDKDGTVLWMRRDFTYDDLHGKMASATDWHTEANPEEGYLTRWVYDEHGRLIATVLPGGDSLASPTVTYEYQLGSPVNAIVTKRRSEVGGEQDYISVKCYDGKGRMMQERSRVTDTEWIVNGLSIYNDQGAEVRAYDPFIADSGTCSWDVPADTPFTERKYDGLAREIEVTMPDAAERGGTPSTTRMAYLPLATLTYDERDTDSDEPSFDSPTTVHIDGLGRATSSVRIEADGTENRVDFGYDGLGNLVRIADNVGNVRRQRYDLGGRVKEVNDPDRGTLTIEHDAAGNPIREAWANGNVIVREYDQLGRKTAEYKESDETGTRIEYFYDSHPDCPMMACENTTYRVAGHTYPLGELGEGEEAFSYDERGRGSTTLRRINGATYLMGAQYDNVDQVVKEIYPGDFEVDYTFDDATRLTAIAGFVSDIEYDAKGSVTSQTLGNGITRTNSYDTRNFLTRAQSAAVDLTYTYDRTGNILTVVDGAGEGAVSQSASFTYDDLGRLAEAVLKDGTDLEETVTYGFDATERLVEQVSTEATSPLNLGAFTYDGMHPQALASVQDKTLAYDASGFATSRGDDVFTYNTNGLIDSITRGGERLATFGYNGTGVQVIRRDGTSLVHMPFSGVEVRDGVARLVMTVGAERIVEKESTSTATLQLIDTDDDDDIDAADAYNSRDTEDVGTLLRSAARSMLMDEDGTFTTFVHTNHQGSVIARSDTDGNIVERIAYSPYGTVMGSDVKQTEYASYATKDIHMSGYINFGQRFLSPEDGRFLSADPLHNVLGEDSADAAFDVVTSYAYARNNPISLMDIGGQSGDSNGWLKAAKVLKYTGLVLGVAATAATLISAGVAISAGTAGIANIVGGIAGAVVSFASEVRTQVHAAREKNASGFKGIMKTIGWKGVGKIALATLSGAGSGFATCGVSAAVGVATAGLDYAADNDKISQGWATGGKIVAATAVAITGFAGGFDALADSIGSTADGLGATLTTGSTAKALEAGDTALGLVIDANNELVGHMESHGKKKLIKSKQKKTKFRRRKGKRKLLKKKKTKKSKKKPKAKSKAKAAKSKKSE